MTVTAASPDLQALLAPLPAKPTTIVTPDGTRLHALLAGSGPPVVLAHAYGVNHEGYFPLANRLLAAGRRVILFDQRGHGASTIGSDGITSTAMAGDYRSVLEHFDVRRAVLVGHSMGGFLALRFMLDHPEVAAARVAHAMIAGGHAGRVYVGSLQNRLQAPLMRGGLIGPMLRVAPLARAMCRSLAADRWTDMMLERFVPVFRATNHRALSPILVAMGREDLYPALPRIQVPCTILVGAEDRTTPAFHARDMARLIPKAELVTIPGARHSLPLEALDLLGARILAEALPGA